MKKHIANLITGLRMVFSTGLLFCSVPSAAFYALYLSAGFTDMVDGKVARMLKTDGGFGAKLDSVADLFFVVVCLVKLLPVLDLPLFLLVWTGVIVLIKITNVVSAYAWRGKVALPHTVLNKITGFMLFLLPLTINGMDISYSGAAVCALATFAAIQEGHVMRTGEGEEKGAWENSI